VFRQTERRHEAAMDYGRHFRLDRTQAFFYPINYDHNSSIEV
jgi:hypothetical protein